MARASARNRAAAARNSWAGRKFCRWWNAWPASATLNACPRPVEVPSLGGRLVGGTPKGHFFGQLERTPARGSLRPRPRRSPKALASSWPRLDRQPGQIVIPSAIFGFTVMMVLY